MTSRYKKYPEYKDSGVEWLGDIPTNWSNANLRWLATLYTGGTPSKNIHRYWENGTIPWLNSGSVNQNYITKPSKYITEEALINSSTSWIPKNALTMALAGQGKTKGMVAQLGIKSTCNQSMAAIVPYDSSCNRFLYWWLTSNYTNIRNMSGGDLRDGLNLDLLSSIPCPLPKQDEKNKISDFLDYETSKIDTLIEKQEKLIELLQEKRQAVISHAVTKGLNSNVPMKDSGVEWLGQVPEHWGVKKAKYIADITRGAILRPVDAPEYFESNGEWSYLNISDVTNCVKYLTKSKLQLSKLGSEKSARVYPNNIILTASATIGKVFINKIKVCVHDGFIPFCKIKLNIDFLFYFLSNPYLYSAMGKSNTQKNIYLDEVKNMYVTEPPEIEQIEIAKYIELRHKSFDKIISKADSKVKLLKERRTSLISAAVTGKIDVRDWVKPGGYDVN